MIKNIMPGLAEIGKIKIGSKGEEAISKGGKKFRLPKKLDHYIITTTERSEEGNLVLDTELMDSLKNSDDTIIDSEGNIVGIPIRLLYNSIDLNFATYYACYASNKLVCSGNGEVARTRDGRDVKCPCERLSPSYQKHDKCRANGKLTCLIDGSSVVGACFVLRTTSINTIKSILGGLAFIQAVSSGIISFLPLHLILRPKTITIPTTGQLSTIYVSSIVYRGTVEQLRQQALSMAKEKTQYLLAMEEVEASARDLIDQSAESELEQKEICEEFYPDAVDVPAEKKPEPKPSAEPQKEKPAVEPESLVIITCPTDALPPVEEPPAEPESEPKPEPEPAASEPAAAMVTKEQKREIVKLKKAAKITDPGVWLKLLDPFGVITANDLTEKQADDFIEVLKVPF